MDPQLRNFKDFLLLYNKITELCFTNCVDNFFTRNVANNESQCVDKCVTKFARFNQSLMNVYVEVQTEINTRRMQELEATSQQATASAGTTTTAATTPTAEQKPISTQIPTTIAEPTAQAEPNVS